MKLFTERNRDLIVEIIRIYLGLGLFAKGVYFARRAALLDSQLPPGVSGTA